MFDQLDLVTYEEVVRLPAFHRKTLVLLGKNSQVLSLGAYRERFQNVESRISLSLSDHFIELWSFLCFHNSYLPFTVCSFVFMTLCSRCTWSWPTTYKEHTHHYLSRPFCIPNTTYVCWLDLTLCLYYCWLLRHAFDINLQPVSVCWCFNMFFLVFWATSKIKTNNQNKRHASQANQRRIM